LAGLEGRVHQDQCCFDEGDARVGFLERLADQLAGTGATPNSETQPNAQPNAGPRPRLFLLDDYDLVPEHNRKVVEPLERILGSCRWVAAGMKPRGFSTSPVSQAVRGARSMVYLRPLDPREAHEVLGVAPPWRPGLAMVAGRGLVMVDRIVDLVQFADPFLDQTP
jgi:hypothetical protein